MKHKFDWNPETGVATCIITYKDQEFIGTAICHPEDMDLISERTGSYIAECRAYRIYYRYIREVEIKPALNALKHAYNIMSQSKYFNENSHEAQVMRKQIAYYEDALLMIRRSMYVEAQSLREYIKNKDIVYNRIRKANKK